MTIEYHHFTGAERDDVLGAFAATSYPGQTLEEWVTSWFEKRLMQSVVEVNTDDDGGLTIFVDTAVSW